MPTQTETETSPRNGSFQKPFLAAALKASEILKSWDRVALAFGHRSSAWLKMLRISVAGEAGMTLRELCGDGPSAAIHWKWMKSAEKAGLLEIIPNAVANARGGRRSHLIKITSLGIHAIGLCPENEPNKTNI